MHKISVGLSSSIGSVNRASGSRSIFGDGACVSRLSVCVQACAFLHVSCLVLLKILRRYWIASVFIAELPIEKHYKLNNVVRRDFPRHPEYISTFCLDFVRVASRACRSVCPCTY